MIFYFSGTGNTRWAAQTLASRLGEQVFYIPDIIKGECRYRLGENERLGFVFPVHGWRPPKIVREFIAKLTIEGKGYTYMLCTAGDNIGRTTEILRDDLAKRGIALHAAFSLIMPEAYVGLPFMDVDKPERERAKILKAEKDLQEYVGYIERRTEGIERTVKGRLPSLLSGPIGGFFVKHLVSDKPFHVVSSRCVRCGICADVCPVHDIDGGLGKEPSWKHNGDCLSCFTCYHHCPHHAIEYGGRTKHKGQYYFLRRKLKQD